MPRGDQPDLERQWGAWRQRRQRRGKQHRYRRLLDRRYRGSSASSGGQTTGAGGADGGCQLLFQEFPDGSSFNHPAACEACTCTAGEVSCVPYDDGPCYIGVPVFPCTTDTPGDAVDLTSAFIQGDLLLLDVSYGGGCETHEFGVCYESRLGDSGTPGAILGSLRLIH